MPLYTEACGARYCPAAKLVKAAQVQRGDQVYVSDGKHSSVKVGYMCLLLFHGFASWSNARRLQACKALARRFRCQKAERQANTRPTAANPHRRVDTEMVLHQTVTDTSPGYARVKYIVTEAGTLVVNGVVASVFSTPAAFWETLPFQILDSLFKVRFLLTSPPTLAPSVLGSLGHA